MDLSRLQVFIKPYQFPAPNFQLSIDLTVSNNLDHAVTIQVWDSPLDPRCALLGIIEVLDATTNELLPFDKVYFARQLPPSPESFVEIGSHQEVRNTVSVVNPKLDARKEYRVEAKGRWKAVWGDSFERIDTGMLETLAGASTGDFVSNGAIVKSATPG